MTINELDARAQAAQAWAMAALALSEAQFAPASTDASFRRYFRICADTRSWIVMDAPPEREPLRAFIEVAGLLQQAGLNVPQILAEDHARGYLLLSDLGQQTFLQALKAGSADAHVVMPAAIDALIRWQCASREQVLPEYDAALLQRELDLFVDWFVTHHLQRQLTPAQQQTLAQMYQLLIDSALAQPKVYVHRDYMPRNLMLSAPLPGILDFQDAVYGPLTYDVVSLFRDAFWSWPDDQVQGWLRDYHQRAGAAGLPVMPDFAEFTRALDWMGVQRHLKVIGIFARICYRDGKPHYLADVPRFIGYVRQVAGRYPELAPLLAVFDALALTA